MDTSEEATYSAVDIVELTAEIISAYVSSNPIPASELSKLITDVHAAIAGLKGMKGNSDEEKRDPAVPVRKSLRNDELVCLECGKAFKSIKRHLRAHHDLSPEEYRERWQLPASYPMVAPDYAKARSELAKKIGLGRKKAASAPQRSRRSRKQAA